MFAGDSHPASSKKYTVLDSVPRPAQAHLGTAFYIGELESLADSLQYEIF
jgi:hypothetical protein